MLFRLKHSGIPDLKQNSLRLLVWLLTKGVILELLIKWRAELFFPGLRQKLLQLCHSQIRVKRVTPHFPTSWTAVTLFLKNVVWRVCGEIFPAVSKHDWKSARILSLRSYDIPCHKNGPLRLGDSSVINLCCFLNLFGLRPLDCSCKIKQGCTTKVRPAVTNELGTPAPNIGGSWVWSLLVTWRVEFCGNSQIFVVTPRFLENLWASFA
jgi:hypothetical protein